MGGSIKPTARPTKLNPWMFIPRRTRIDGSYRIGAPCIMYGLWIKKARGIQFDQVLPSVLYRTVMKGTSTADPDRLHQLGGLVEWKREKTKRRSTLEGGSAFSCIVQRTICPATFSGRLLSQGRRNYPAKRNKRGRRCPARVINPIQRRALLD